MTENVVPLPKHAVLDAFAIVDAEFPQWAVWCLRCQRWHVHGGEPGHRAAHCDEPGAAGYEGRLAGTITWAQVTSGRPLEVTL